MEQSQSPIKGQYEKCKLKRAIAITIAIVNHEKSIQFKKKTRHY